MRVVRLLSAVFVAVVLTGCATVDTTAVRDAVAGKSVAVVSNIDSTLQLSWIGTTAFNNESTKVERPDWALASLALKEAETALIDGGRFKSVKALSLGALSAEELMKHPDVQAVDLVVVIDPTVGPDFVPMFEVPLRGIGVRQRSALGFPPYSATYAALKANLVDSKTGKPVAQASETMLKMTADKTHGKAALDKGAELKPALEPVVSEDSKETVKSGVRSLIKKLGLAKE